MSAAFGISADRIVLNDELEAMAGRLVGSIGLGRQRQLAFACALGHEPALLVLDEPTSGVDPLARARLWDAIRSEAHRGVGVLVTTHYMEEAQQCDRLVLMSAGKVAAEGTEDGVEGPEDASKSSCSRLALVRAGVTSGSGAWDARPESSAAGGGSARRGDGMPESDRGLPWRTTSIRSAASPRSSTLKFSPRPTRWQCLRMRRLATE